LSAAPQFPNQSPRSNLRQISKPTGARSRWQRVVLWVAAISTILFALMLIAVLVVQHSSRVHAYLLRVAQSKASAALGTSVTARDFSLRFAGLSPTLDISGVAIQGQPNERSSNLPLATAEDLRVALTVTSLLHRNWYVDDVTLVHPVIHFVSNKSGTNNLPTLPPSKGKSNPNFFDLGVRHARIENGEVFYNDIKSALSADLHELNFRAGFNVLSQGYSGTLSYRDGHVVASNLAPVPHELDADFVATRDTLKVNQLTLRSGSSNVVASGIVQNFANPQINLDYRADVDATALRKTLKNSSLPQGVVNITGKLSYIPRADQAFLQVVNADGAISSTRLIVATGTKRGEIRNIAGNFALANGNFDVQNLTANLLGGRVSAALNVNDLAGNTHSRLTANVRDISLSDAARLANPGSAAPVAVSGRLQGNASATWGKTTDDLVAHADATITGDASVHQNSTPIDGSIHAGYFAKTNQLSVTDTTLRLPQTSLTVNGTVSRQSSLRVHLQSHEIHELEVLAEEFRPQQQPLDLYGVADLDANVTGSLSEPSITGHLNASGLRTRETAWRSLRGDLALSPSHASVKNAELDSAQRGSVKFNVEAGLNNWAFTENSPVLANVDTSQLDVLTLTRAAGVQSPLTGMLSANVAIHGTQINPIGQGEVKITSAKIYDQPLTSLVLSFNGDGQTVHTTLDARDMIASVKLQATLFPKQKSYEAELHGSNLRLADLEIVKEKQIDVKGTVDLQATGEGTFDDPGLNATVNIPQLTLQNQMINDLKLHAVIANHVARVDLTSQVAATSIEGHGTVNLSGDETIDAKLDTKVIALGPVLAIYFPAQAGNLQGQTELHATIKGPLKNQKQLEAHAVIPTLQLNYKNLAQIAAAGPINLNYKNGTLDVQRGALRGTGTDVQFEGRIPMTSTAPASLLVQGTVDLKLAQLFDSDISSSGQVKFDINSYGARTGDNVKGQIQIVNANFATGDIPLGLQNGNGVLTLLPDRLQIKEFKGMVGGGDMSASGALVYRPTPRFDLALTTRNTRLLYSNVRGELKSNLTLVGTTESAQLRGQIEVEQMQFTPDFDLSDFMSSLGGGAATAPPTGGLAQAIQLDVGVASTSGVSLVGRTLSLQAAANLRVMGTAAQPVILGRMNIDGGDLIFYGNRYVLQDGTVDFVNASQTQPVLNLSATTDIQQYNVQIHLWGPVDHLHTNYSSDPALPPSDIINLVAFGQTQESSAANPSPSGNLEAEQVVASQVSGQITNRVEKVAGFSQLSVDPVLAGTTGENPGARITVQRRVTGKIFVTFSTDVTSTEDSVIKLEYQQSPRVSYSGTRDQNGGFGFDRRIRKEW
jgi:translocation and assembly module TamB